MYSSARRALRWFFSPVSPSPGTLPVSYWRWTWAAMALRLFVGLPLVLALVLPYTAAHLFMLGCDWLGGLVSRGYTACYNKDLKDSGWKPPQRRAQTIRLNPEWASKVPERETADAGS